MFSPPISKSESRSGPANEYVIKQCGADTFSYVSDYPHEVDLVAAKQMIHDTVERPDLTHSEKAAVLGGNAKRFFRV